MTCAEAVELDQHAVCDEDLAEHKQPLEPLEPQCYVSAEPQSCRSVLFCSLAAGGLIRALATPWTYFLHLSLSSVILIDLPRADPVHQTWNWVIGSPGQWVIWVIFHVQVTGSSF